MAPSCEKASRWQLQLELAVLLHHQLRCKLLLLRSFLAQDLEKEEEANRFAADTLVPPQYAKQLPMLRTNADVVSFASKVGVAPGILVGRMQHDGLLTHARMNGLKLRYSWAQDPYDAAHFSPR